MKKILMLVMSTLIPVMSSLAAFNAATDIFIPQFDSNHDPDDIHSIAALGCMLAHEDYANVNYLAVHGAYGIQNDNNFIASPKLFTLVFGAEDDKWVNASPQDSNWNGAVAKITAKVKPVLTEGGKVWVAEAGQSDITADWVAALIADGVSEATIKANVIVVQHSDWNEDQTTSNDLAYVKSMCNYQTINDGNGTSTARDPGAPATPAYRSTNTSYQDRALASQNIKAKAMWQEAKWVIDDENYFPSHSSISVGGVDYSDVVESHWIFGAPTDCDTNDEFWDKFITNLPVPNDEPEFPTGRDYNSVVDVTPTEGTWIEKDGILVCEMEHAELQEKWTLRPASFTNDVTMAGSLGDGWIEWAGAQYQVTTISDESKANGISIYRFKINTAGDYTFRWRSKQYTSVASGDAGNDSYVKFETGTPLPMTANDGSTQTITKFTKVWVQSQADWSWNTSFEPLHGVFVSNPQVHYEAGIHEIRIAGRSTGHAIDRFVLYHSSIGGTAALNADESARVLTSEYTYAAVNDFSSITGGEVPYYKDNGNNALAINAGNTSYRDKFAKAALTFDGVSGFYDVQITTLTEEDGESTYNLLVNGVVKGTYTNPYVGAAGDLNTNLYTWVNVQINQGDSLAIESKTDTNGEIAEGDGTAWSRGRWRQIELTANLDGSGLSVSAGADQTVYYPPVSITISGSAHDDGTVVSTTWTQLSGPNDAVLSGANTVTLSASNLIEGSYVFRLTARDDDANSLSDEITVQVKDEPPVIPTRSLWTENFEGESLTIEAANTLSVEVVDAPAAFTNASGKVIRISTGANNYAAVRSPRAIDLSSYYFQDGDHYSISFDIYIPGELTAPVGGVNFRWKNTENTGNGPTDEAGATLSAGVYHVEYTGTFPVNTGGGDFMPTSVQPFVWFDQDGVAAADYAYMDHLDFKIWAPNAAPKFTEDPVDGGSVGSSRPYSGSLIGAAADPNGDEMTFAYVSGPTWLVVDTDGTLSGTPGASDLGTNVFEVSVEDPDGASARANLEIVVTEALAPLSLTSLWEENFDGVAIGESSGNNETLSGTAVQTANNQAGRVVAVPAGFTTGDGNVFLLSTAANKYSAVRSSAALDLSGYNIQDGDRYKLSFDMYIPADLVKAVGDIQYRWNGVKETEDSSQVTLSSGVHHIEYSGSFPLGVGIPTSCQPFIGFDQDGAVVSDYVYMDHLKFEIWSPDSSNKTGFEKFEEDYGLTGGPLGDDDGDGVSNLDEYAFGGHPRSGNNSGQRPVGRMTDHGFEYIYVRSTDANKGIRYRLEQSDSLIETNWTSTGFTVTVGGENNGFETVTNEILTAASRKFIRLNVEKIDAE